MYDWDFYCTLCGALFSNSLIIVNNDEPALNEDLFDENTVDWLKHVQIVDKDIEHPCGYISDVGHAGHFGTVEVPDNVLKGNTSSHPLVTHKVYRDRLTGKEHGFPFHPQCLQILRAVLATEGKREIEADILFDTMAQRRSAKPKAYSLTFFYYELDDIKEDRYYYPRPGQEPFISDPIDIPGLKAYLANLPILEEKLSKPPPPIVAHERYTSTPTDAFATLPSEIIMDILLLLPRGSIIPLFLASPAVRQTELSPFFWKHRLRVDMPWLWDVTSTGCIDWRRVYETLQEMQTLAQSTSKKDQDRRGKMIGMCNRRRIWNVCVQVAALYLEVKASN
ncbi:hypothetical protein FISHEDRAFT_62589 [Fistulina hepatica ATCC 64428]|nr:hypothetical protein FISHEDRAFT_62589 [Fistulina hepatica ATCC 64428]